MYVYVYMYVAIRHPCGYHTHMCEQIDTVKIVSVDCVLTLNVAHQTTEARRKGSLRLKWTRKRRGRILL